MYRKAHFLNKQTIDRTRKKNLVKLYNENQIIFPLDFYRENQMNEEQKKQYDMRNHDQDD